MHFRIAVFHIEEADRACALLLTVINSYMFNNYDYSMMPHPLKPMECPAFLSEREACKSALTNLDDA